jgi:ABC-2 type transport system permease protein
MFSVEHIPADQTEKQISERMGSKDALVAIVIPENFSAELTAKAKGIAADALKDAVPSEEPATTTIPANSTNPGNLRNAGDPPDSANPPNSASTPSSVRSPDSANPPNSANPPDSTNSSDSSNPLNAANTGPIILYYHPVLQASFRQSIQGALKSTLQIVESRQVVRNLYLNINDGNIPDSLENQIVNNQVPINEIPVSRDGSRSIPNASQHNIPAWTVFAMFFVVISLGGSVVREKLSGSFTRLKTLPTNYLTALISKQLTYVAVTFLQAVVIFSIGIWLFPIMGLPRLNLPADIGGLVIVTLICGWCAASYAICVGVLAKTQEQSNGFGAVSIVLLAAVGGILVPSFAMPTSFKFIMQLSPLHWCLEAYYGLFLEGGNLQDILINILPLLIIIIAIQMITLVALRRKNLI